MPQVHITDTALAGSVESSFREAAARGVIADADLSSKATALAAVATKNAKQHISDRQFAESVKKAIDIAPGVLGNSGLYTGGTTLNTIYTAVQGNWNAGFPVAA
jgi:hypothetical protein